jgi:putative ATP-dependent endonuclease of OLD family
MRVRQLSVENFRGIKHGKVRFEQHTLLVGGNNMGKSTVCEALDLVLGPDRLNRRPLIDEHDFHMGIYVDADTNAPVEIRIQVVRPGDLGDWSAWLPGAQAAGACAW